MKVVPGVCSSVTLKTLQPMREYTFRVTARHRTTKQEGLYYQSFQAFLGMHKCRDFSVAPVVVKNDDESSLDRQLDHNKPILPTFRLDALFNLSRGESI